MEKNHRIFSEIGNDMSEDKENIPPNGKSYGNSMAENIIETEMSTYEINSIAKGPGDDVVILKMTKFFTNDEFLHAARNLFTDKNDFLMWRKDVSMQNIRRIFF